MSKDKTTKVTSTPPPPKSEPKTPPKISERLGVMPDTRKSGGKK